MNLPPIPRVALERSTQTLEMRLVLLGLFGIHPASKAAMLDPIDAPRLE